MDQDRICLAGRLRILPDCQGCLHLPVRRLDGPLFEQRLRPLSLLRLAASGDSQFFRTDPDAYDDLIRQVARDHNVDFALIKAIMHAESGFNPYARSSKGALGLMQLLPATAKRYGVDDMYDPAENIRAGVQHIKYLLGMFSHKYYLVLAAYNAGENAVKRHKGIPPYRETQAYVRKVLQYKRYYSTKS